MEHAENDDLRAGVDLVNDDVWKSRDDPFVGVRDDPGMSEVGKFVEAVGLRKYPLHDARCRARVSGSTEVTDFHNVRQRLDGEAHRHGIMKSPSAWPF